MWNAGRAARLSISTSDIACRSSRSISFETCAIGGFQEQPCDRVIRISRSIFYKLRPASPICSPLLLGKRSRKMRAHRRIARRVGAPFRFAGGAFAARKNALPRRAAPGHWLFRENAARLYPERQIQPIIHRAWDDLPSSLMLHLEPVSAGAPPPQQARAGGRSQAATS